VPNGNGQAGSLWSCAATALEQGRLLIIFGPCFTCWGKGKKEGEGWSEKEKENKGERERDREEKKESEIEKERRREKEREAKRERVKERELFVVHLNCRPNMQV
jgi:hypothetical protein